MLVNSYLCRIIQPSYCMIIIENDTILVTEIEN